MSLGEPSTSSSEHNVEGMNNDDVSNKKALGNDDEEGEQTPSDDIFRGPQPNVNIKRPILTVPSKHHKYKYSKPDKPGLKAKTSKFFKKQFSCSSSRLKELLLLRLPIIHWIMKYDIQAGLLGDIIAGITIAVMHIPQGMAYAMLAEIEPVSGIYMAFFPVLIYAIFASSRHLSMGTFAVICLMTGKVVTDLSTTCVENVTTIKPTVSSSVVLAATTMTPVANCTGYSPTEVATIVSFGVAVWMLIFGLLNLGTLSVFLSDMLVSGFTTGAAIHVFTSQVKSLFGVEIKSYNDNFKIILTWIAIFKEILNSNPATMVISMICIIVLLFNNEVIKPRLRKVTMIPIPIELIVVVVGTLASRYGHLEENFDIQIVGPIPTGLPPAKLPPFELFGEVFLMECFTISVVSYSISFSMAKIFAKKKGYTVDPTQELYATSFGNFIGSLFQCAPISGSLSRSLIQVNVGGYSQLTSFISCTILLFVLLFIGPFFETLPNCVLAAIIVTALKGMFLQFGDFTRMLKISKIEATLWMVTFLGVVIIDIDIGLLIGIVFSLLILIVRSQLPIFNILGRVTDTDIYLDKNRYASVIEIPGLKICQLSGTLYYANQESVRLSIFKHIGIDPRIIIKRKLKEFKQAKKIEDQNLTRINVKLRKNSFSKNSISSTDVQIVNPEVENNSETANDLKFTDFASFNIFLETRSVILDMSGVYHMDITFVRSLGLLYDEFKEADVALYFACFAEICLETMEKCGADKDLPKDIFFHTVHDAVIFITETKKHSQQEESTKVLELG